MQVEAHRLAAYAIQRSRFSHLWVPPVLQTSVVIFPSSGGCRRFVGSPADGHGIRSKGAARGVQDGHWAERFGEGKTSQRWEEIKRICH